MVSVTSGQITQLLLEKQGCLEFRELSQLIRRRSYLSDQDVFKIISPNTQFVLVENGNNGGSATVCSPETLVIAKTHLCVCPDGPDKCKTCEHLQICRYFVCGTCKFGNKCRMSHDVKSTHNTTLLKKAGLQDLKEKELFQLLLQNDPKLLPEVEVCPHYNKGNGEHGGCKFPTSCTNLHVCQHYLQDNCKFGASCKRAHKFDTNTMKILKRGLGEDESNGFPKTYKHSFLISCHKGKPAQKVETVKPVMSTKQLNSGTKCEAASDEICLFYIRGGCIFKEKCARVHHSMPYKWQYLKSGTWEDFSNGEDIERTYCNPADDNSKGPIQVNFEYMTYNGMKVRRLSTVSSGNKPPHFVLTTNWTWYWKDERGRWIEYGCGEDAKRMALITSKTVEEAYLKDPKDKLTFRSESHEYTLNFQDMRQQNLKHGTIRYVRRRPRFVSAEEVERKLRSERSGPPPTNVPDYWEKEALPNFTYKLITLSSGTDEYRKVETLFKATMPNNRIKEIQRVQNSSLWKVFQWQKEQMEERNGGRDVEKRYLFHGTDASLKEVICEQNFDWRAHGKNGTVYGKGSYFARDASYSNKYAKSKGGIKMMFVALVLVGEFTKGTSLLLRPPQKKLKPGVFYDSCVDKETDPSIFVIFEKYQIYPEYVIEYFL
ncbi:protein mono-ADP-ribosyltransferase PARP12-like isoform X1 [Tachysurus fulvidraco]|uniref:protein mono-ADP-ribosyltransferase PARP12-like isoform X1 n=1 Tax=Tachysurus fulvidraco TaxID=1234273 RepID=UPI001FEED10C|nr:protein mono-ADP-ribosyltransferase PARP12-like isoform X1 [Tachysurus fulvidraco]